MKKLLLLLLSPIIKSLKLMLPLMFSVSPWHIPGICNFLLILMLSPNNITIFNFSFVDLMSVALSSLVFFIIHLNFFYEGNVSKTLSLTLELMMAQVCNI